MKKDYVADFIVIPKWLAYWFTWPNYFALFIAIPYALYKIFYFGDYLIAFIGFFAFLLGWRATRETFFN